LRARGSPPFARTNQPTTSENHASRTIRLLLGVDSSRNIFHTTSGPSWSKLSLAPTCSTRLRQLAPRK